MRRRSTLESLLIPLFWWCVALGPCAVVIASPPPCSVITTDVTFDSDVDATGCSGIVYTIGADNITIDGGGFLVDAPDAAVVFELAGRQGVTVTNFRLATQDTAFRADGAGTSTISESQISGPPTVAVHLHSCVNLTVSGIQAPGAGTGVEVLSTSGSTIENCDFSGSTVAGFLLQGSSSNTIRTNTLSNGTHFGVTLQGGSNDNVIEENVSDHCEFGLAWYDADGDRNIVRSNDFSHASKTAVLLRGRDWQVVNNRLDGAGEYGLYIWGSGTQAEANTYAGALYGIRLNGVTQETIGPTGNIRDWDFTSMGPTADSTIYLQSVQAVTVSGVKAAGAGGGVYMKNSSGCTIENCDFSGSTASAIILQASSNNTLRRNTLSYATHFGVSLQGNCNDNVIEENVSDHCEYGLAWYDADGDRNIVRGNDFSHAQKTALQPRGQDWQIVDNRLDSAGQYGLNLIGSGALVTGNMVRENQTAGLAVSGTANAQIWRNNIHGNVLNVWGLPIELSNEGEGNYWGRDCPTLFVAGVDSNAVDVVDSYPYGRENAWDLGLEPGVCSRPPVADAGFDQVVATGTVVMLDGSGSWDPDGDPLTCQWTLDARPPGSAASLSDPAALRPTFTADLPGEYKLSLVATDGYAMPSAADTVLVETKIAVPVSDPAGNEENTLFGKSVATAGDVNGDGFSDIIIGAPQIGSAFVFLGSPDGLAATPDWSEARGGSFGCSVATAGDVNGDGVFDVIVGDESYTNGEAGEGAAFVYLGSASGLSTTPDWAVEGNEVGAHCGASLATAGDVNDDGYADVIIGCPGWDGGLADQGLVLVFLGSASGLSPSPDWTAKGGAAGADFGASVATAGDVNGDGYGDVIIGAPMQSAIDAVEGSAYVYLGSASGLAASPDWVIQGDQTGDDLGRVVATAGDVNGDGYSDVLVGAPLHDKDVVDRELPVAPENRTQVDEGRAYLYLGSATGVSPDPAWVADNGVGGSGFGFALATAGDVNGDGFSDILIGAADWSAANSHEGRLYVYLGSASGPAGHPDMTADGEGGERLGAAVATAGDVNDDGLSDVIAGSPLWWSDRGRAHVYHGSGSSLCPAAAWTVDSDQDGSELGATVAAAGDVNGDGFSDFVVGSSSYTVLEARDGRAWGYYGSATGPPDGASWTADGETGGDEFGRTVAPAGDVNGDGYADLIVGAPSYGGALAGQGRVHVFSGSASGLSAAPAWVADGDLAGAAFGISVASAGDVNGDGYADVIIGASTYDNGEVDEGRAYLYYGSASGLSSTPAWVAEGDQAGAELGLAVASAGDVNGDGVSDVIVQARGYDNGETDEGRTYVFYGSASGLSATPDWTVESHQAKAGPGGGGTIASAGDVNGDGFTDIIIGTPFYDAGHVDNGKVEVYHGSYSGLPSSASWTVDGKPGEQLGFAVAAAGDVNGDGYADVLVGAPGAGKAYLYHGSASGLSATPGWVQYAGTDFGSAVAPAGDVNGDGYGDALVGASQWGQNHRGRVFLYYGNGGEGLDRIPRQARYDDAQPLSILGFSDSHNGFRLKARGRTPRGRGQVRLEWEIKTSGTPFDGMDLHRGEFHETGSPMSDGGSYVDLNEVVGSLPEGDSAYHWRLRTVTTDPFFPHSPWLTMPDTEQGSYDVRVPNHAPTCVAGGPYEVLCPGQPPWAPLDGSASSDPDQDALFYEWSTDCPDGAFDDAASPTPVLFMTPRAPCPGTCSVSLALTDWMGMGASAARTVTFDDTTTPTLVGVLEDIMIGVLGTVPDPPPVTATDPCDPNVSIDFAETRVDGDGKHDLIRSWTATDSCGNERTESQTITVLERGYFFPYMKSRH